VISDPGDDPSVEGAFATQEEADAFIEQTLAERRSAADTGSSDSATALDREGLRPDNWRPLFRIEPASEPESS
jgi:hypothetical protein